MLIADFYSATKRQRASVVISTLDNGKRSLVIELACAGKAEARKIANERGAKPWNF